MGGRGVPWEIRESRLCLYPTTPTQNVNSKIHLRYVDFFENPLQDKHVLSISFKSMKTSQIVFISMCTTFTKLNTLYIIYYYNFYLYIIIRNGWNCTWLLLQHHRKYLRKISKFKFLPRSCRSGARETPWKEAKGVKILKLLRFVKCSNLPIEKI